jgi:hypothetical protein
VGGGVFGLRESRSAPTKGRPIPSETSELIDGTLIGKIVTSLPGALNT